MIVIRKSTAKKIGIISAMLVLTALCMALFIPGGISAAQDSCGNGVCDYATENSDLCLDDCECTDNGVVDLGEPILGSNHFPVGVYTTGVAQEPNGSVEVREVRPPDTLDA